MDFSYDGIAHDMWHEVIHAGKDLFKIHFDLENDTDITSPFTIKNSAKFLCQAYVAGGDWECPVLYYRCQLIDNEPGYFVKSFGTDLSKYNNAYFVFIPTKADGNNNLVPGKKGYVASQDTDNHDEIDERKGRKALKGYLNDIVKKTQEPEETPEEQPEDQEEITEELNQDVKMACAKFDNFCTENSYELNIVKDEPSIQAFVLPVKDIGDKLNEYMQEVLEKYGVKMEIDDDRRDGCLITISKQTINDDGHWEVIGDKEKEDPDHIAMSPLQNKDAKRVRKGKTIYQQGKKYRLDEIWRSPTRVMDRISNARTYSSQSQYFSKPNTCDPKQSKKTKPKGIEDKDEPIEEMEYKPIVGRGKIAVEEPDTNDQSANRTNDSETGEDNDFYGGKKHSKPQAGRKDLTDLDPTDQDNPFEKSFLDDEQDNPFEKTLKDFSKQYDFTPLGNRLTLGRPGEANRPMDTGQNVPSSSYQPDDPIVEPNQFTTVIPDDSATKDKEIDNTIADTAGQLFGGLSGMTGVRPQKVPLSKGSAPISNATNRRSGFEQPDIYKKDHSFIDDTEDIDDDEEDILKGILDTEEEDEEKPKFKNINSR